MAFSDGAFPTVCGEYPIVLATVSMESLCPVTQLDVTHFIGALSPHYLVIPFIFFMCVHIEEDSKVVGFCMSLQMALSISSTSPYLTLPSSLPFNPPNLAFPLSSHNYIYLQYIIHIHKMNGLYLVKSLGKVVP